MNFMTTTDIRAAFLAYFQHHGHTVVDSASLVPKGDQTLLFTNAGMVPFKDVFLGQEQRPYQRACSAQRCVRAGGKHNDLEQVGYTKRHHTFFEMMGNFSFGDYFKREAIQFAWQFLTETLKIPAEKLWVTVYREDEETEAIWLDEMGISPTRFSRCGEEDNFWSMGETGPCGPCTEIFYDHGPDIAGGPPGSPDQDGDRYVEIWNLVFMQYNRDTVGELTPLPSPCVDTGMGLERIASVMQGVHDNYETDLFKALLAAVSEVTGCDDFNNQSMRVIADHIRACAFLIVDGVVPANEGRGYVLRRIIRRAIRHGHKLGVTEIFFHRLVASLVAEMGTAYPELGDKQAHIEHVLQQEETQFLQTLDKGMKKFDDAVADLTGDVIPGEVVFMLYDTYGFPPDLTADIARERNLGWDNEAFTRLMEKQRQQSQSSNQFKVDLLKQLHIPETTVFTGYEHEKGEGRVVTVIGEDYRPVSHITEGQQGILVLDRSPFYAESGGQVGDTGVISDGENTFDVLDTKKHHGAILHIGVVTAGVFSHDQLVHSAVSMERNAVRANHTATHLLHQALREILGIHVTQKGSMVSAARLRFDFSHGSGLTKEELAAIEIMVNTEIRNNVALETGEYDLEEAKNAGAMALFGEKYEADVRVVTIGNFSKEVCGGTHVQRTGDIGAFKIVTESACAAGVRRIEALTGRAAMDYYRSQVSSVDAVAQQLNVSQHQVVERVQVMLADNKSMQKELVRLKQQLATAQGASLLDDAVSVGDIKVVAARMFSADRETMRESVDRLKDKLGRAVVVLGSVDDNDQVLLVAGVSKCCTDTFTAGNLMKALVAKVGGKGGGRPDFAQGGGTLPDQLPAALDSVVPWVEDQL